MSKGKARATGRRVPLGALVLGALVAVAPLARAAAVPECLLDVDVPGERRRGKTIVCTDCDPACDRDGVPAPNGSCTFVPRLCLGAAGDGCGGAPIRRVRVRSPGSVPVPAPDVRGCAGRGAVVVRTRGRTGGTGVLRAVAVAGRQRDRERLRLVCRPRPAGTPCPATEARERCAQHDPLRRPFFGDLHVHTRLSFDAQAFDVRTTPTEAYAFAQGAPVRLPPLDQHGVGTRVVQLDRPLDFAAVTDHSEFLGDVELCTTPGAPGHDGPSCTAYRDADVDRGVTSFGLRLVPAQPSPPVDLCGADGQICRTAARGVWQRVLDAAEAAYDRSPACRFTTFPAYEWTGATGLSTRHRNVVFRTERVPAPISYFEQPTPVGLWRELRLRCLEAPEGCDVLAIPHNSNESNGTMFRIEYGEVTDTDAQRALAAERARLEPLVEIYQHKGDSECMNGLAGLFGAPDELCEFEKEIRPVFEDCGEGTGSGGVARLGCFSRRDFVRGALLEGLREHQRLGVNPLRLGFIGSTDTHNGTPGLVDEVGFPGHRGTDDDTPAKRLGRGSLTLGGISFSPGGLAGVWAEENSRSSLFEALRRRETFGTSGPRIVVRFFAGWELGEGLCEAPDLVRRGYERGVPMGADLPPRPAGAVPRFVVAALRDPGTAGRPGTPLQAIQIVKGWIADGERHHEVVTIAGALRDQEGADPATCVLRGGGADSLCATWTDPDFDPAAPAFYYARVIEQPTCRWHAWACDALAPGERPASCTDPAWPRRVRERAWTSPIWYAPVARAAAVGALEEER